MTLKTKRNSNKSKEGPLNLHLPGAGNPTPKSETKVCESKPRLDGTLLRKVGEEIRNVEREREREK